MPQIPRTVRNPDDKPLVKVVCDSIPQPDAGQNVILTCPMGYRLQLKSLFTTVVTDANVVDRNFFVQLSTAAGTTFLFRHPFIITNGETRNLNLSPLMPLIPHSAINMFASFPFPDDLVIEEGSILTIGLSAIQVGDQFTATPYMLLSQFVAE